MPTLPDAAPALYYILTLSAALGLLVLGNRRSKRRLP